MVEFHKHVLSYMSRNFSSSFALSLFRVGTIRSLGVNVDALSNSDIG